MYMKNVEICWLFSMLSSKMTLHLELMRECVLIAFKLVVDLSGAHSNTHQILLLLQPNVFSPNWTTLFFCYSWFSWRSQKQTKKSISRRQTMNKHNKLEMSFQNAPFNCLNSIENVPTLFQNGFVRFSFERSTFRTIIPSNGFLFIALSISLSLFLSRNGLFEVSVFGFMVRLLVNGCAIKYSCCIVSLFSIFGFLAQQREYLRSYCGWRKSYKRMKEMIVHLIWILRCF